jgi:HEAT repeat protein
MNGVKQTRAISSRTVRCDAVLASAVQLAALFAIGLAIRAAVGGGAEMDFSADEPPAGQTAKGASRRPSPSEHDALLTRENYDKIQPGMTREELTALLGPFSSSAGSGKDWKLTWRPRGTKNQEIEIHLHDGQVTTKHSTMAWQAGEKRTPSDASSHPSSDAQNAKPPVEPNDKLQQAIDNLKSRDNKKIAAALRYLETAPLDEERAPEISKLVQLHLADKDLFVSTHAKAAIKRWATKENVPYFVHILSLSVGTRITDDRRDLQPLAIEVLVRLRDPEGVAPIAKLLTGVFDHEDAEKALIEMGPKLAEKEVLKYANHQDPNVARWACEVLTEFKTSEGTRLAQCLADLKSPVADKRLWAAQAIGDMTPNPAARKEVASALEPLLTDKHAWPTHAAAAALVKWGIPENEPALIAALGHASPDMRRLAAEALAKIGTKNAFPALEKIAADEKLKTLHPETAQAAQNAVAKIRARTR